MNYLEAEAKLNDVEHQMEKYYDYMTEGEIKAAKRIMGRVHKIIDEESVEEGFGLAAIVNHLDLVILATEEVCKTRSKRQPDNFDFNKN